MKTIGRIQPKTMDTVYMQNGSIEVPTKIFVEVSFEKK